MKSKRAEDLMVPLGKYPHIPYWFTLRQAMVEMDKSQIEVAGRLSLPRVILVFDETYRLLGIVRRRDLLRGLEPKFLQGRPLAHGRQLFDVALDPNLAELSYDRFIDEIRQRADRPVSDVMLPIAAPVDSQDHVMKIVYEMVDKDLSLLPVLKDGRVVGVVRTVDVFREIAQYLL